MEAAAMAAMAATVSVDLRSIFMSPVLMCRTGGVEASGVVLFRSAEVDLDGERGGVDERLVDDLVEAHAAERLAGHEPARVEHAAGVRAAGVGAVGHVHAGVRADRR